MGILRSLLLCGILPFVTFGATTASIAAAAGSVTIAVTSSGTYTIAVPDLAWTFSGSVGCTVSNLGVQYGTDTAGGAYSEISFDFSSDAQRHAAIRGYAASRSILFTVSLPSGGPNSFAFPALTHYPTDLKHIAFAGLFGYPTFYGSDTESPWVSFDSAFHTAILSPASHFMVASTGVSANGQLTSGINSQIASLPPGFTQQTLLVVENGINGAFDRWGSLLTGLTGKVRPPNDADVTLSSLGYWTDAGSSYYYATQPGLSYPDTLAAVRSDFEQRGFALGYMQLDSWFYPKGAAGDWMAMQGGIYQYFAATPPFASSLASFQTALGIPLIAHGRWIDTQSPYRQEYLMSGNVSIDPLYWGAIGQYLGGSGAAGYEQDWLFDQASTDYNLTDGDLFLGNMASALGQQDVAIQYCSASTRHFLQSAMYNNVTTIRASGDRFDSTRWTSFLYASRLVSAVGAWPFTDVFLSGETSNLLLATLSAGPVGVGDSLGSLDAANLRQAVRPDGVIVKPDVPIAPIDSSYWSDSNNAQAPIVAATYSDFGNLRAWYLFLYAQGATTQATFRLSDAGVSQPVYLWDYFQETGRVAAPDELLSEDATGYRYLVAAPIGVSGIAVLGDAGHFVSLGRKRITALSDDGAVHVTVSFAARELSRTLRGYAPMPVTVSADSGAVGRVSRDTTTGVFTVQVMPGADGAATVRIAAAPDRSECPAASVWTGRGCVAASQRK